MLCNTYVMDSELLTLVYSWKVQTVVHDNRLLIELQLVAYCHELLLKSNSGLNDASEEKIFHLSSITYN